MTKLSVAIFLFLLSLLLIGQDLNKPFWGEHDWNGVRYGNIARNYLRYGFLETKLGQVENSGPVEQDEFEYYTHYPPVLPIVISISYSIFGISEFSTRLIPLLSTTGSIVLIFLIGSRLYNLKIGIITSFLALVTPMVRYFGKIPSHEPLTLFIILVSFYGYILLGKKRWAKFLFVAGLIFAQMTAWAGFFLIPAITLVSVLRRNWKHVKVLIPYWFLSILIFLIHLGHVYLITGTISGGNLFGSLLLRSGISQSLQPEGFDFINYLNQLRLWLFTLFTLTLILLAITWVITKKFTGVKEQDWSVITLGIVGLIYILLFSNSVFIHNYLIIYFLPFMSLSAAAALDKLIGKFKLQKFYLLIVILFILAVGLERREFLLALNESQIDQLAVTVGKAINQETNYNEVVLVSPLKFSYSADKFLKFYGDRKLEYTDNNQAEHNVRVVVDQESGKFEIIRR